MYANKPKKAVSYEEDDFEFEDKGFKWHPRKSLPSPPSFEKYSEEKTLLPHELFDGFKFEYVRPVAETFRVSHALHLGSASEPPTYTFSPQVSLGEKGGIQAASDSNRKTIGFIVYSPTNWLNLQFQAQHAPADSDTPSNVNAEADLRFKEFNCQFKYQPGPFFIFDYSQSISRRVRLGVEQVYSPEYGAMYTFGARYEGVFQKLSGILTGNGFSLCYGTKVPGWKRTTMYTEFSGGLGQNGFETATIVGFQQRFARGTVAKAQLNSAGKISSLLHINMGMVNISWVSDIDHSKPLYKYGFGVQVAL